jgi:hypothetical protein
MLLVLPATNPAMLFYSLKTTPVRDVIGINNQYVPLMPSLPDIPHDTASRAQCSLIHAMGYLQYGLTMSPAMAATDTAMTGNSGVVPFPQPHLGFAWWAVEAVRAVYFDVGWNSCEGYPSPLLLLDLAERATLVCCGVMKRWHMPFFPRGLALLHLTPLEKLLSWSFHSAANISRDQKGTLEVISISGIAHVTTCCRIS